MRKWIVAGNWKMHNTIAESIALAKAIKEGATTIKNGEVVLAPPFTAFSVLVKQLRALTYFWPRKTCILKTREHSLEKYRRACLRISAAPT